MTDKPKVRLSVTGTAVGPDGSRAPFTLSLSEPFPHDRFDWQCQVVCPTFAESPMHIYGFEAEFAWDLTLGFVHRMLGFDELTIVDDDGKKIELPQPDWARWDMEDWTDETG